MTTLDRVKDRIRKLLNVAKNDAATDGEIGNAITAARSLLHAYNLEEADVHQADDARTEKMDRSFARPGGGRQFKRWEYGLAYFCNELLGVSSYSTTQQTVHGSMRQIVFFGLVDEVSLAQELFTELQETIATMAVGRYGSFSRNHGRSYCEGFVDGLMSQLTKSDVAAVESSEASRQLVARSMELVAKKKQRANLWLQQEFNIRLRSVSRYASGAHFDSAFARGQHDGENQNIQVRRDAPITDKRRLLN